MKSYEEFEREFKDNEPPLSPVKQAIRDRLTKILNQRHTEVSEFGVAHVKRELQLLDLRTEEIEIIELMSQQNMIEGNPTNNVYSEYIKRCGKCGIQKPMSLIGFSKFLVGYFDLKIINKKIEGKKRRVFVSKDSFVTLKKCKHDDWWRK